MELDAYKNFYNLLLYGWF